LTSWLPARWRRKCHERILSPLFGGYGMRWDRNRMRAMALSQAAGDPGPDQLADAQRQALPQRHEHPVFRVQRVDLGNVVDPVIAIGQRLRHESPVLLEGEGAGAGLA